jgi:hypothetical protein
MSIKERLNKLFFMCLEHYQLFKDSALFSDLIAKVSYVVSDVLVKNETLQLLRIIKECFCAVPDGTFCGKQVNHCLLS